MIAIEHRSAVRRAHRPDLLAKKSRSTVSCPILACSCSISRSRAASASRPTPGSNARAALLQQLLLPGINLVRVNLVALRQIRHRRLLPQRLQGDLRLQRRVDLPSRLLHHPLRLSRRNGSLQLSPRSQIRGPLQETTPGPPRTGCKRARNGVTLSAGIGSVLVGWHTPATPMKSKRACRAVDCSEPRAGWGPWCEGCRQRYTVRIRPPTKFVFVRKAKRVSKFDPA